MRRGVCGLVLGAALVLAAGPAVAEEKDEAGGYRMTTYVVGFLYRGPTWTPESTEEVQKLQVDHLAHIERMAASGDLILAGPFMDDGDLRGLLVFKFDGESPEAMVEKARSLVAGDPMVKSGRLVVKLHPWYSAEGIAIVKPPRD